MDITVFVCVCLGETVRDCVWEREKVIDRECKRERESVYVCICNREREWVREAVHQILTPNRPNPAREITWIDVHYPMFTSQTFQFLRLCHALMT